MASSQASMSMGADSAGAFDPSEVSSNANAGDLLEPRRKTRRKRWTFQFHQRTDGPAVGKTRFKVLALSCRCKSVVRGSCLIVFLSFVELLGSLIGLIYGISYIKNAYNFYDLDSDPEQRVEEYTEKLETVLFLEQNRVGFVGLLALCVVGILISLLMPLGSIYKSWRCLRAAMTLLFSACVVHLVLACLYLYKSGLVGSIAVIPYRACELFLISSYITFYKRKKMEELKAAAKQVGILCGSPTCKQQKLLDSSSIFDKDDLLEVAQSVVDIIPAPVPEEVQITINIGGAKTAEEGGQKGEAVNLLNYVSKRRPKKKRAEDNWNKREERKHHVSASPPDRFCEYDFK